MKTFDKANFRMTLSVSLKNLLQLAFLLLALVFSGELMAQRGGYGKAGSNGSAVHRQEKRHPSNADRGGRHDGRDDRADYRDDRRDDRWDRHRRHYRHCHRYGQRLHILPVGYRTVWWRGSRFYFHAGLWFSGGPSGYVVITAPVGAHLTVLPDDYLTVAVGTGTYYYYYGTYYRFDPMAKVYVVVTAPVGAEVPAIPEGYIVEHDRGVEVFVVGAVRYRPVMRGGVRFFVVL
ncbi:MAG: DUF6515 family protein [Bacteroidota bacterium]